MQTRELLRQRTLGAGATSWLPPLLTVPSPHMQPRAANKQPSARRKHQRTLGAGATFWLPLPLTVPILVTVPLFCAVTFWVRASCLCVFVLCVCVCCV